MWQLMSLSRLVDSVGGELLWAGGVSLISDILGKGHWPLKTHLFFNTGRLDRLDLSEHISSLLTCFGLTGCLNLDKSLKETTCDLFAKPAVSAGVGVIYKFDPIRLEVNFGVPLIASRTDKMRRGFQMGIGLEFL